MAMMCGGPDAWTYIVGTKEITPDMPQHDGIVRAWLSGAKGIDVIRPPGVLPIIPIDFKPGLIDGIQGQL